MHGTLAPFCVLATFRNTSHPPLAVSAPHFSGTWVVRGLPFQFPLPRFVLSCTKELYVHGSEGMFELAVICDTRTRVETSYNSSRTATYLRRDFECTSRCWAS